MNVLLALFFSLSLFASEKNLEHVVDQVISAFENGSTEIQYNYIEHLHDGRGYTAGKAGFTTGTGDLYDLVKGYSRKKPDSLFTPLLPILRKRAEDESSSVHGLRKLISIWKKSCLDPDFIAEQDLAVERMYKTPTRKYLRKYRFSYPLTYLIFYDAIIQHGNGSDPDSFNGIVKLMKSRPSDEKKFAKLFLKARLEVLSDPSEESTAEEWGESLDRVYALQKIVKTSNWNLETPFNLQVWGDLFRIKN